MFKKELISLMCMLSLSVSGNLVPVNASISLSNTKISEYYTPTLDDDFDNDEVILTLDNMYSGVNKPIIIENFLSEIYVI